MVAKGLQRCDVWVGRSLFILFFHVTFPVTAYQGVTVNIKASNH